jgi:hypothetical protein
MSNRIVRNYLLEIKNKGFDPKEMIVYIRLKGTGDGPDVDISGQFSAFVPEGNYIDLLSPVNSSFPIRIDVDSIAAFRMLPVEKKNANS